jgi:hypothetical protein
LSYSKQPRGLAPFELDESDEAGEADESFLE